MLIGQDFGPSEKEEVKGTILGEKIAEKKISYSEDMG